MPRKDPRTPFVDSMDRPQGLGRGSQVLPVHAMDVGLSAQGRSLQVLSLQMVRCALRSSMAHPMAPYGPFPGSPRPIGGSQGTTAPNDAPRRGALCLTCAAPAGVAHPTSASLLRAAAPLLGESLRLWREEEDPRCCMQPLLPAQARQTRAPTSYRFFPSAGRSDRGQRLGHLG